MRFAVNVNALRTCVVGMLAAHAALAQDAVTAFVDVTLVPLDRERVVPHQTVIVSGARIAAIGDSGEIAVPAGADVIDGRNGYLLPALAEMHIHLPTPPTPLPVIEDVLFLLIANGVTTARGMMGHPSHIELRERIARGEVPGPTLYLAGPPLERNLTDPDQARRVVRNQAMQGFDFIKVVDVGPEVYAAIVETAGELGIPVAGHTPRGVGIRGVLEAGQASVEHLDGYIEELEADDSAVRGADLATRSRQLPLHVDTTKIPELVAATRSRGTANTPTLAVYEAFFSPERGAALRTARPEVRYLPREWVDEWVARKDMFLDNPALNVMGFAVTGPGSRRLLELRKQMVRSLADGNAQLLLGTDALQLFMVPGFSVHAEMRLWSDAGLSSYRIVEAATRNVAAYFGAADEFGTVEVGKRADLLLVSADPLRDVANLARRVGVMVRGRWLPEAAIQERLARIAAARTADAAE